jgi:hypothetical protein
VACWIRRKSRSTRRSRPARMQYGRESSNARRVPSTSSEEGH